MHNLWFFCYFFQKLLFTENYFLIAAINLATRGPLYTCLVFDCSFIFVCCIESSLKKQFVLFIPSVSKFQAFKGCFDFRHDVSLIKENCDECDGQEPRRERIQKSEVFHSF